MKRSVPSPCCGPVTAERFSEDGIDTRLPASVRLSEGTRLSPAHGAGPSPAGTALPRGRAHARRPLRRRSYRLNPILCLWGRSGSPPRPPPAPHSRSRAPHGREEARPVCAGTAMERHSSGAKRRLTPTVPRSHRAAQASGVVTALKPQLRGGGVSCPGLYPWNPPVFFPTHNYTS